MDSHEHKSVPNTPIRCDWCGSDPLYIQYHDDEWGTPEHNDRKLFEMLCLEGQQAGLSWITVLKKRENYRKAFYNFEPQKIIRYVPRNFNNLMQNAGIIRNKLKIESIVRNAKAFLKVQKEFGTFDKYIWGFVDNKPIQNNFAKLNDLPAKTDLSDKISKDLKKRGFNFVGSTIVYAYMQAIGMVNDHTTNCIQYKSEKDEN